MSTPINQIKRDPIWFKDVSIIFNIDRLSEFFPNEIQTNEERMNSLVRFSIYASIILALYNRDYTKLIWIIVGMILSAVIYTTYNKKKENFVDYKVLPPPVIEEAGEPTVPVPTEDNPFMNLNITDFGRKPTKKMAPNYFEDTKDSQKIRKQVYDKFSKNLYKDIDDVYDKSNMERQFYTMPNTENPSDQDRYIDFLYGDMKKNCKSDKSVCEPYSDLRVNAPILRTSK